MSRGADGETLHGGGEDQPHGVHIGVAVHRLRYLRQEGEQQGFKESRPRVSNCVSSLALCVLRDNEKFQLDRSTRSVDIGNISFPALLV